MTPTDTVEISAKALVASALLAACDEEIELARRMGVTTARHGETWGRRGDDVDSAYSRAGFASSGRETLETIVGDGLHAARASTEVRLRYDGWATVAEQQGCAELAAALRAYVRDQRRGVGGLLVRDAVAYLEGAREVIAAA